MIQRAFRYRLRPTEEQAERFDQFAGVTRLVYNLALEQRRTFCRQYAAVTGRPLTYEAQSQQLTQLRAEVEWIGAVHSTPLQQALRDLDKAFSAFFSGRSRYPTRRRKGQNDAFRFAGREVATRRLNHRWSAVRIPKIGWVKYRDTRPLLGRVVNVTVVKDVNDWYVCFASEIEHETPENTLPAIGIDRGVANTLALSTGEMLSVPDAAALEKRRCKAQRILARRKRGSSRYRKQRARVARISAKIARCRADWRHRASLDIAQRFGFVAVEALKIQNMTRSGRGKRGLNRSILDQGWGAFERCLSYKLTERGGKLVKINPAYTSQTCSDCGTVDKASRESQASFACRHCGFRAHSDINAAINILRRSTSAMLVEGSGCAPVEARTDNHALAA